MAKSERNFKLPQKLDGYLAALNRYYDAPRESLLREIVVNGLVTVHEEWDYDNWDGGTYGHAVTLTVPAELYLKAMRSSDDPARRIADDLNKLDHTPNEHVSVVFIEMEAVEADRWREESGVLRARAASASVSAEALQRIWGTEHVRLFLSHKSSVKKETSLLKQAFARCGIAAFVAHEDIEPTQEWQHEIERALFSMDALIGLLSPDFHDSKWTDQEVGVAIGRGVPIIAVRLGLDPYGLMGKAQGLGACDWSKPTDMALKIVELLHKRLADKSRLFECALAAYDKSASWEDSGWAVKNLLSLFESLNSAQVERILAAYHRTTDNKHSFKGRGALMPLLEKWTGTSYRLTDSGGLVAAEHADKGYG